MTRRELSITSGFAPGGTFTDYVSSIKKANLASEDSHGLRAFVGATPRREGMPDPMALKEKWGRKLKAGARRMLDLIVDAYPDGLTRAELSEKAGYAFGGTFTDYLGSIKRPGLVNERDGQITADPAFFFWTAS